MTFTPHYRGHNTSTSASHYASSAGGRPCASKLQPWPDDECMVEPPPEVQSEVGLPPLVRAPLRGKNPIWHWRLLHRDWVTNRNVQTYRPKAWVWLDRLVADARYVAESAGIVIPKEWHEL